MIHPPKTRLEDLKAFIQRKQQLNVDSSVSGMSKEEFYDKLRGIIKGEFKDRLFPEDEYLFMDYEGLETFLKDNDLPISSWVSHEKEHAEEAHRRGINVEYGLNLVLVGEDQIGYMPFVRNRGYLNIQDILAVSSAPGQSSELDKSLRDKYLSIGKQQSLLENVRWWLTQTIKKYK